MAKKPKPEGKKYSYMDTYGDLVTLLMCFFVLLFAMSTVEENKYNAFVEALSNRFGAKPMNVSTVVNDPSEPASDYGEEDPTGDMVVDPDETLPADFMELHEAIAEYIEESGMEGEISVEVGESGATFIRLSDNLLFAGESFELLPDARAFCEFLGAMLVEMQDQIFQVRFMGHTASIAGSSTDDWILAQQRSGTVASFFERQVGFPPVLMQATGYGRHYPIADNSTEETRALNRRVDMVIISNDADNLLMALAEASAVYFPGDSTEFFDGDTDLLPQNMLDKVPAGGEGVDLANLTDDQVKELYDMLNE